MLIWIQLSAESFSKVEMHFLKTLSSIDAIMEFAIGRRFPWKCGTTLSVWWKSVWWWVTNCSRKLSRWWDPPDLYISLWQGPQTQGTCNYLIALTWLGEGDEKKFRTCLDANTKGVSDKTLFLPWKRCFRMSGLLVGWNQKVQYEYHKKSCLRYIYIWTGWFDYGYHRYLAVCNGFGCMMWWALIYGRSLIYIYILKII